MTKPVSNHIVQWMICSVYSIILLISRS